MSFLTHKKLGEWQKSKLNRKKFYKKKGLIRSTA